MKVTRTLYTLSVYLGLGSFIYFVLVGVPLWNGFFYTIWLKYKNPWFIVVFPIFILLELIFQTLVTVVYRRRFVDNTDRRILNNTALVIPCHKSEAVIAKTIEAALKSGFTPSQIFVIDNGKDASNVDSTPQICREIGTNYVFAPYPSKLTAIYVGVCQAKKYEYVLQIDDDVLITETLPICMDPDVSCMAYTIGATNHSGPNNLLQNFQDLEYKMAGLRKGFEGWTGSAYFAHGAISLWRREALKDILEKHPMYPISDDWFIGYIANCNGYRIDVCDHTFVQTDVPGSYFGFFDKQRTSGYGSQSLFNQRFSRWYRLTALQVLYILYHAMFVWRKYTFVREVMMKLMGLSHVLFLTLATLRYTFLAFNFINAPGWTGYMFIVIYAVAHLNICLTNYYHLKPRERIPYWQCILFHIYGLVDSTCLMLGMLYSIFFYIPFVVAMDRPKMKAIKEIMHLTE